MTPCSPPIYTGLPTGKLATCLLDGLLNYSSTLKMEAICSSETSVDTLRTTRHIPEDDTLHNRRCENLKSYICLELHENYVVYDKINTDANIALSITVLHEVRHGNDAVGKFLHFNSHEKSIL
jgi:hypothetical protein